LDEECGVLANPANSMIFGDRSDKMKLPSTSISELTNLPSKPMFKNRPHEEHFQISRKQNGFRAATRIWRIFSDGMPVVIFGKRSQ
jgi:hypothetical protein